MLITSAALTQLRIGFSAAFNRGMGNVVTVADKIATTVPSSTASNLYGWLGSIPGLKKWIGEREISSERRKFLAQKLLISTEDLADA